MSNYLAISTVTAALYTLLTDAARVVPGTQVTTVRPDGATPGARPAEINIFLYQVEPNGAYRNADLPTRRSNGDLAQVPQAALDLHYLLSFYGNETVFEPQRLLGSVVRSLHAHPVLSRQLIQQTLSHTAPFNAPPLNTPPNSSDLADQVDMVRFTPISLTLEELSKLWSIFFQVPYALSVAYQAGVVLIQSDETPQPSQPVRARNVYTVTFHSPIIDRVISAAGQDQPIVSGSTLLIQGQQLQGDITHVLLGGAERTPSVATNSQLTLPLPPDVPAGVQGLQVIQLANLGTPPVPHRGVQSNVAAFVLRPSLSAVTATASAVNFTVSPQVRAGQRVALLLNEFSVAAPAAYTFVPAPPVADTGSLSVGISGVKPSTYLVRLQVDGAESPLDFDEIANQYTGPTVTIP